MTSDQRIQDASVPVAAEVQADANGWRDIASAPKDGRWLLVTWLGHPHRCEAMRFEAGDWYWWEGDCTNQPPTHWQPLPLPPQSQPGSGE